MIKLLEFVAALIAILFVILAGYWAVVTVKIADGKLKEDEMPPETFKEFSQESVPHVKTLIRSTVVAISVIVILVTALVLASIWTSDWRWALSAIPVAILGWLASVYLNACKAALRYLASEKEKADREAEQNAWKNEYTYNEEPDDPSHARATDRI